MTKIKKTLQRKMNIMQTEIKRTSFLMRRESITTAGKMKLGMGLYRDMLDREHFRFARQCGCTHAIVHLVNYYTGSDCNIVTATDANHNYGVPSRDDPIWTAEGIRDLQALARSEGIEIYGVENFNPIDWYDILLDGPKRDEQIDIVRSIIGNVGRAGIKAMGYNFSLAGVWGHQKRRAARGGAISTCFDSKLIDVYSPIPNGLVWNMECFGGDGSFLPPVTDEQLWDRLKRFLDDVLPAAEAAGVELALHPDDPPMKNLRGQPRLVYQPSLYQKVIDLNPSPANKLEFCMGSVQEMTEGSLTEAIEQYGSQKRISYIHFRNVRGKIPCYDEVFLDEGDIDMLGALRQLQRLEFDGVLIPDHTPLIDGKAPWETGMAFALGYMRAAFQALGID